MNLTERILELLRSDTLKTREVADILGASAAIVSGTISRLVRQGLIVVVDNSRNGHWTYRAANGASNQRSSSVIRRKTVNKELRKHFRVFRPTHDNHVLGVWV